MRLRGLGLAIILAAIPAMLPLAARAQPFKGFYIGAGAGVYLPENIVVQTPVATNPRAELKPSVGFAGLGSIGYGFGNGFRVELEGNYRHGNISNAAGPFTPTASGSIQTYGAMANVLFDMDIGFRWLYPYVGGGVGYAATHLQGLTITPSTAPAGVIRSDATEGGLAYQAIAGLSFPMPYVPGLSLTAEYRFVGVAAGEKFSATIGSAGASYPLKLDQQYSNNFMFGVRYAFGVAPPPPPPAAVAVPAPAPARSYLVFFDWDKATLTDRARAIIREAADNSTKVQYTKIEVNGHTDTSGTPQYNMGLSMRRAQAVAAELVKDGVPKAAIAIQGFGETHLLVATGPGVREPQNRRVEIVIQ